VLRLPIEIEIKSLPWPDRNTHPGENHPSEALIWRFQQQLFGSRAVRSCADGKMASFMGGGSQTRWRADGRELYFIALDGKLMAASMNASGTTFAAAPPVALFQTRILGGGTNLPTRPYYAVSRDGRFLILHSAEESAVSPITLLLNWKRQAK
jgi:hypothetical protein